MQIRVICAVFVIFLSVASARGQDEELEPFVFAYTSVYRQSGAHLGGKRSGTSKNTASI